MGQRGELEVYKRAILKLKQIKNVILLNAVEYGSLNCSYTDINYITNIPLNPLLFHSASVFLCTVLTLLSNSSIN